MRHPDVATIKTGLIVEVLPSLSLQLIRPQFFVIILGNTSSLCVEDSYYRRFIIKFSFNESKDKLLLVQRLLHNIVLSKNLKLFNFKKKVDKIWNQ